MLLRACDIDKRIPAKRYTITVDDGRTVSKDLCEEHAEPFEEWLEEAELGEEEAEAEPEPLHEAEPEPEQAPVVPKRRTPAKKATAKKAATKKAAAPARRRPRITTLDEIEASKKR
ncbi:hypothetical protein [Streptomyces pseudovenezuelae]|uniref:hypothetical protein n=1 Tax=Streptomyces pseudovenezuelae TaxID=67350 RepID=UPI002E3394B4|nr:hypothetical protein [Streptomyces pseudovenezuelae]